jgi:hypothetical protein
MRERISEYEKSFNAKDQNDGNNITTISKILMITVAIAASKKMIPTLVY